MNDALHIIADKELNLLDIGTKAQALSSLESGQVIYLPNYSFTLKPNEYDLLSDNILGKRHKNISYDYNREHLSGLADPQYASTLQAFMHRYAEFAKHLLDKTLAHYQDELIWGRTSYRPAQIKGRTSSALKDDTRLHVDSFSATPVNGLRILRVFCNINPTGEPRVWELGESFSEVLAQFSGRIPSYSALRAHVLKWSKTTKTLRSPYDHYMLQLHNQMKLDTAYQQNINKTRVDFPPQSTWIVYTDQVSHAALSGQFLLEQTFYLPVNAQQNQDTSPLRQWEKLKKRPLI